MRYSLLVWVLVAAACAGGIETATTTAVPPPTPTMPTTTQPEGGQASTPLPPAFGGDGNRVAPWSGFFITGSTTITRMRPSPVIRVDLPTDGTIAIGYEDELRILTTATDELVVRPGAPSTAVVYTAGAAGVDVLGPLPGQAPHSRPGVLSTGHIAYVTTEGDLVIWDGAELMRVAVDALADGDVLVDERDRILVLTGPTDRYPHGILGDPTEAAGFTVVAPPDLAAVGGGTVDAPGVIEGRRALWTDLDGDGAREVLITVSDSAVGARLVAMAEDGTVIGSGQPIGRGNRWRHQIAFGDFAARPAIAEVVTPHLGGIVSFSPFGAALDTVATVRPYTSHRIGARELDMAAAVDIDDDGFLELVLPTQDRAALVGIGLVDGTAAVEWTVPVQSPITSNVAVGTQDGVPTIAVGTRDGDVYLLQADE